MERYYKKQDITIEVNKELPIFTVSINKIVHNGQNVKFWKDRWLNEYSLQSHYPILYELSTNTVSQVIGYNSFYLTFNRPLNHILQQ
jgi:hypothetical protein